MMQGFSKVFLSLILATLVGCTVAVPEFSDPLANIGQGTNSTSPYKHLTIGVLLSENTKASIDHLAEHRRRYESVPIFKNKEGMADLDPNYLTQGLNDVLTRRFKSVRQVNSVADGIESGVDLVALLDVRAEVGSMTLQTTKVTIATIFVNEKETEIGRAEGEGIKKVPYPANTPQFKAATNDALTNLANRLDQDPQLATILNAAVLERIAAASLPTTSPSQAQRWKLDETVGFGQYHALVIGNNDYQFLPQLQTAIADAKAVSETLKDHYGFEVVTLYDATRADILRTLNLMRRTLTNSDNLLVYYAGHGWLDEDAGRGYWLPVDAAQGDPTNWVSNASITDALRAIQAKHVMVVADSCYSGTLTRGVSVSVPTPDFLQRIASKRARTVLTSGGLEPVSDDGSEGHSVFALAFLNALRHNSGILDGHTLFADIRRPIMLNSNQTPEYGDIRLAGHDGGDFLFVPVK